MSDFASILELNLNLGGDNISENISPHNLNNQVIDREKTTSSNLSKNDLLIYERYGLLPEEIAVIEEALDDTIERNKPKKIKGEKEDEKMGLSSKVYKYLEENLKNNNI